MDNIISIKKSKIDKAEAKRNIFLEHLEQLKDILKSNIKMCEETICPELALLLGPLYWSGNDDEENVKIMLDFICNVLKHILDNLESEPFKGTIDKSDFPFILEHMQHSLSNDLPISVALPFTESIYTIVLVKYMDMWLISDIYSNHRSMRQHAFETLMRVKPLTESEIFYNGVIENEK